MANAAWKTHLLRLKHFKEQSKEADNKSFDEVLTRARITIMEYDLFTALVHSLNSPKVAKGELDRLIEMLDKAKLVVGDLGATLWSFVRKVLRGLSVLSADDV